MCGIIGYIGFRQAQNVLLQGLEHLEYRGYDSTGIAVMTGEHISISKSRGRLCNLQDKLACAPIKGTLGIGHTRWATHGEPSDTNAHPHTDMTGSIAIVHNGIIENHDPLRAMLESHGCTFVSTTDTEVIAHLLQYLYNGDMVQTLRQAQTMLEGSYALCVLSVHNPDTLYCTRKDSPLVLGLSHNEQFVASDIPALIAYTKSVDYLQDMEIAAVRADRIEVYDASGCIRKLKPHLVAWSLEAAEKSGYDHFMLKEIHEEPSALRKTFSAYVDTHSCTLRAELMPFTRAQARNLHSLAIVACGTAYHAGVIGKYAIETLARLPVHVDLASEFRYRNPPLDQNTSLLAISQSGETADTLAALREGRRLGAKVLALTNVVGSTLAHEADTPVMYTYAGPEIAVASTKAYITQVESLLLLAIDLAQKRETIAASDAHQLLHVLKDIPTLAEKTLQLTDAVTSYSNTIQNVQHLFYIGRGMDYALALEGSLKLKEVSYIPSEAYAAGELKHGSIALIEPRTLVCALATQPHLADKTLANIREVKARGARTLIICTNSLSDKFRKEADTLWLLPDAPPLLMPLLAVIPLQLLAYNMAVIRGCDVDKPRNLAKSVTVE